MTAALDYLPTWKGVGLCAGQPESMVVDARALNLCRACPVLDECRDWVLSIPIHEGPDGVVAGLVFAERERILLGRLPPKTCNDCQATKPLHEFAPNSEGKPTRRAICRPCMRRRENRSKAGR